MIPTEQRTPDQRSLRSEQRGSQIRRSYISPALIVFVVLGGLFIYQSYELNATTKRIDALTIELASTNALLYVNMSNLSKNVTDLSKKTAGLSTSLSSTQQNIDAVRFQVGGVAQSVGSISGTVDTLQKLAQADPQLLKKYSKVYFTNENYVPAHLITIPFENVYSNTRTEQFLSEGWPFLQNLLNDAQRNGHTLYVKSGYRSFAEQKSLKSSYTITYGAGTANAFSAEQGYSEHQLGTTIDFITSGIGGNLDKFDRTQAYEWLRKNAHRYGFILSYPKGNNYYVYEPWHWRFVGVKLATYLHDSNLNFYTMDQRDIDKFLINLFD